MSDLPARLRTLTDSLDSLGIDAMLVTDETNVRYLSGFTGDSSYLLVAPSGTTILSDGRYQTQIAQQCGALHAVIRSPSQQLADVTQSVLNDLGAGRIGIEASHLSLASYRYLAKKCATIELVETTGVVERQRMVKDDGEIEITRQAIRIAERAMEAARPMLTPACSERSIAHDLESKMRLLGAEGCSFDPIVAVGPSAALPHYEPTDATIGDHPTLLIDWGANYLDYASDLTRTFHRDHCSDAFRRAYEIVLEAQLAAIEAIGPGVPARDVDAVARRIFDSAGMGEAFMHGLGHGIGLQIHESPRMSSIAEETLASGMIITVEPGVYFAGEFGIRIEDDVLVTPGGHEVLSRLPKGLDDSLLIL